jgi:RNA polymerase sigma factor (sigma-70 family)
VPILTPPDAPGFLTPSGDETLAARIANGESAAEAEFVSRFERPIFVMLLSRTKHADTARDLTQNVFLAALTALRDSRLESPDRLAAFVHGIARNVVNNHFRERSATPPHVEIAEDSAWVDGRHDFDRALRLRHVREELAQMDRADQQVLQMTLVEGLKSGEIASRLGLSVDVLRTRKSRAIKRLIARVHAHVSRKPANDH